MSSFEMSEANTAAGGGQEQGLQIQWSPEDNLILKVAQKTTQNEESTAETAVSPRLCGIRPLPPCHVPGPIHRGPDDGGIPRDRR